MSNLSIRKKEWYEINKDRLKEKREKEKKQKTSKNQASKNVKTSKNVKKKDPINFNKFIVLTFLAMIVLTSSGVLVVFSVEVLGKSLIGWILAILLEIGIISTTVMHSEKRWEQGVLKGACTFFVAVSFFILHTGNQSNHQNNVKLDRNESINLGLAEEAVKNAKNMPSNYYKEKNKALNLASKRLNSVTARDTERLKRLNYLSNLGMRLVLLLLNLIFCHTFVRILTF